MADETQNLVLAKAWCHDQIARLPNILWQRREICLEGGVENLETLLFRKPAFWLFAAKQFFEPSFLGADWLAIVKMTAEMWDRANLCYHRFVYAIHSKHTTFQSTVGCDLTYFLR